MFSTRNKYQARFTIFVRHALPLSMLMTTCLPILTPAYASIDNADDKSTYSPSGMLLLPLTPKLDVPSTNRVPVSISDSGVMKPSSNPEHNQSQPILGTSAEKGEVSAQTFDNDTSTIDENKTLKGTIQIIADDTEFDQDKNTFLGTGNAVAIIGDQNSKLQADSILYDQNNQTIDARGNVSILRDGQLTSGSAFKFNVTSDEYLITQPETLIESAQVIARKSTGNKIGVAFKDGTMDMSSPFILYKNLYNAPLGYREEAMEGVRHPQAYLPEHPSFKFKARKMVYERYKEQGNLTVLGGRLEFGDFSVPVGTMVCTVGQKDTKAVMPITPYIGNNLWSGGMNVGVQFNTGVGKESMLSWSPMVQLGGRPSNNTSGPSIGLAGRVAFTNPNFQAHLAYGSVSNLLIADLKGRVWRTIRFQTGINRFLPDGMLGMTRARLALEVFNVHNVYSIPYLGSLTFRTTAGWYQDNPQLVYISSTYAKLHGNPNTTVMNSAYKVQQQIMFTTHPLFNIGDDRWGIKSYIYGGVAARAYSSGTASTIGQLSPILDIHASRVRFQTGYTSSAVGGKSPFVFDQYIQGQNSVFVQGDVKISKYLSVGGMTGYNMTDKLNYARTLVAAIGPPDFKLIIGKDFIFNNYRVGFNVLYGQPTQFDKLVFKNGPDHGQLGSTAGGI